MERKNTLEHTSMKIEVPDNFFEEWPGGVEEIEASARSHFELSRWIINNVLTERQLDLTPPKYAVPLRYFSDKIQ